MDLVFLDANVLFSAAYRPDAGILQLWKLPAVELISSSYAVEEARRNVDDPRQGQRLDGLVSGLRLIDSVPDRPLPAGIDLPEKDRPILLAALAAGATHLVTGDLTHFGALFGTRVESMLVLTPARYLAVPIPSGRLVSGTRASRR